MGFSLHLFFYVPFIWITSLVARYNILLMMTLFLNGLCAYRLGRYLSKSFCAGLVCGVMYLLSPYALLKVEQGFLQKAIIWWIPLFFLYIYRFFESGKKREALFAGVIWSAMALTYAPYAWYSIIAGGLFSLFTLIKNKNLSKNIIRSAWPAVVFPVGTVLFLAFHLPFAGFRGDDLPDAVLMAPNGSLDIFHFLRFHPYNDFLPQVDGLYLGISCIGLLALVSAVVLRMRRALSLSAIAISMLLIALGPYLSRSGEIISKIPLPYYFIASYLPWGERLGFSIRALPFFEIAVACLMALCIQHLKEKKRILNKYYIMFTVLLLALIGIERRITLPELFPPIVTNAKLSEELQWIKDQGKTVMHLPFTITGTDCRDYCYTSARTETAMLNCYLDAPPNAPVPPFHATHPEIQRYLFELYEAGCRLIAVHPKLIIEMNRPENILHLPTNEEYSLDDVSVLAEWCGPPVFSNANMIVYKVESPSAGNNKIGTMRMPVGKTEAIKLLVEKAFKLDLQNDPVVRRKVEDYEERLIMEQLLKNEVYSEVSVSDSQVRKYYEQHKDEFSRKPQIRVHQFFISLPENTTIAEKAKVRQQAEKLSADVSGDVSKSFGMVVEDLRGKADGLRWGDVGYFSRGTFSAHIEDEIFALEKIGETTIVEDAKGFHMFRLMDIRAGREFSFEAVRETVRERAINAARRNAVDRYLSNLKLQTNCSVNHTTADEMVRIPAGSFWMGSTDAEIDKAVAMAEGFVGRIKDVKREWFEDEEYHLVSVQSFYIDRCEVTVGEYRDFLKATGHSTALHSFGSDIMPITGVNWFDADAYARWRGKRLPTAQEWEWAARGPERRWFAWGDEMPDGTRANYADADTELPWRDLEHSDGYAMVAPVGRYPAGATPDGLLDMSGNIREWTSTERTGVEDPVTYQIWPYSQRFRIEDGENLPPMLMYTVKGGSWNSAADDLRCSDERMLLPETSINSVGFRCVSDKKNVPTLQECIERDKKNVFAYILSLCLLLSTILVGYKIIHPVTDTYKNIRHAVWVFISIAIFAAFLILLKHFGQSLFGLITREDGPVEWLTVLCCLFSFFLMAFSFRNRKTGTEYSLGFSVLFMLGALFFIGEELDWGQRIFGFQSPALFDEQSVENYFNLHNLWGFLPQIIGYFILFVWVNGFFVCLRYLPMVSKYIKNISSKYSFNIQERIVFNIGILWIIGDEFYHYSNRGLAEVGELFVCMSLLLFCIRYAGVRK